MLTVRLLGLSTPALLQSVIRLFAAACLALLPVSSVASENFRSATTQTSIGLFYMPDAPELESLWQDGDTGTRLFLQGRVLTRSGTPVGNALVELWHADAQGSVDESRYRTAQRTKPNGTFQIRTVLPGHIEMARYNPVYGPRHIHVVVTHSEHQRLVSLIFFKQDERLTGTPYPELAIHLEEAGGSDDELLIGQVELVLE